MDQSTASTCPSTSTTTTTAREHLLSLRSRYEQIIGTESSILEDALAAYVASTHIDTVPIWLLLVGPPSSAKTLAIKVLSSLRSTVVVSRLTEAALLSGTSSKERSEEATGGILIELPNPGVLLVSDLSPYLDSGRHKIDIMSAFRDIHDGTFVRHVGTDGGRALRWDGHAGLIGAATMAIDRAYHVRSEMGERFIYSRLAPSPQESARTAFFAMRASEEEKIRALREPVSAIVGSLPSVPVEPEEMAPGTAFALTTLATLASWLRSAAPEADHTSLATDRLAIEQAPRLVQHLRAMFQAYRMIGLTQDEAWHSTQRIALSSPVPSRTDVFRFVQMNSLTTRRRASATEIAAGIGSRCQRTTQRVIEDLLHLGILDDSSPRKTLHAIGLSPQVQNLAECALTPSIVEPTADLVQQILGFNPVEEGLDGPFGYDPAKSTEPDISGTSSDDDDDDDGGGGGGGSAPSLPPDEIDPADGRSDALWEKKRAQELLSRSGKGVA